MTRDAEDYTPAGAGAGWSGTLLWMAAKEKAKASAQRRYQETAVSIHGVASLGPKSVHHETPVTAPDSSVS